jgi:Zn finger protein HypA/HybF involved in hydrogenase expression
MVVLFKKFVESFEVEKMDKKPQEKVKEVLCNKCGKHFTSKRTDNSCICCPACGSNESLSIRY